MPQGYTKSVCKVLFSFQCLEQALGLSMVQLSFNPSVFLFPLPVPVLKLKLSYFGNVILAPKNNTHEYVVTLTWSEPTKAGACIRFHSAYLHCLDQGSIWHVLLTDNELKMKVLSLMFFQICMTYLLLWKTKLSGVQNNTFDAH